MTEPIDFIAYKYRSHIALIVRLIREGRWKDALDVKPQPERR